MSELDFNFSTDAYCLSHMKDVATITRSGTWWSAALLIEDPNNGKPFVALYKWQRKGQEWKKSTSYKINSRKDAEAVLNVLRDWSSRLV